MAKPIRYAKSRLEAEKAIERIISRNNITKEPWEFDLNPHKNNDGLKDRHILYAPMEYARRILPVKLTVKEYLDPQAKLKLYALEAIDFDLDKKKEDTGTLTAINPK